ncbi:UNVERIFIED_CONTAM: hypothetical protein Sradi_6818100 [Sesamum radiatum]|uniref:Uncharacterized protein n=1 Tax=Sesamum radiatum TaxID=300843 RepID=A0AAW2JT64_SESRA
MGGIGLETFEWGRAATLGVAAGGEEQDEFFVEEDGVVGRGGSGCWNKCTQEEWLDELI